MTLTKHAVLHPKAKYYGISLQNAPQTLAPLTQITKETGKKPSLDLYFVAWGSPTDPTPLSATPLLNACHDGIVPILGWESWQPPAFTQTSYSLKRIAGGAFDSYIAASARTIASTHCPVVVRLDAEMNGNWYPWGHTTAGMHNTYQQYRAMWQHVWRIFAAQHATNVVWMWAPNFVTKGNKSVSLAQLYPGNKYVDWVGIDGYYTHATSRFAKMFTLSIKSLTKVAPNKPWILSETGVGSKSSPTSTCPSATGSAKSTEITNLVSNVATRPHFNGLVYFDQHKSSDRCDWRFDSDPKALAAFKKQIDRSAFAAGRSGALKSG